MSILVTGGAGFIGSQIVKDLLSTGKDVVVLDNLSTGHAEALRSIKKIMSHHVNGARMKTYYGDTRNRKLVTRIMTTEKISAVVHLAAYSQVTESMQNPGKYFDNNLAGTLSILDSMHYAGVKNMVFSSSAAVYGEPLEIPISEKHPTRPTNVYGASKLMAEDMLSWYDHIYGMKHIALRYFNAAGADASGMLGEHHEPETHLIPLILQTVLGKRESLTVYGDDYPTNDGTCIRDYIHVSDLASAHILALEALKSGMGSRKYNLGNGSGFSVKNVLDAAHNVTGIKVRYQIAVRRQGDPALLVANAEAIKNELKWNARYADLETIIASAWQWHQEHQNGYYI